MYTRDMKDIEFMYPSRQPENPDMLRIQLYDVRAADDLIVSYDFQRDGWVISYAEYGEMGDWIRNVEQAFIPAWANGFYCAYCESQTNHLTSEHRQL